MHARMKARMDAEGLPYGERTRRTTAASPRSWASGRTPSRAGKRFTTRCSAPTSSRRATSRGPRCCSRSPSSVGLPVDEAREVLEQRTFKAAMDEDWKLARQYGSPGCRPSSPAATAWWARSPTRRSRSWCGRSRSRATLSMANRSHHHERRDRGRGQRHRLHRIALASSHTRAAIAAEAGIVRIHAHTIRPATPQRTAEGAESSPRR